jgi:hypothetical protein
LPPQPSETGPQFLPAHAVLIEIGVQPHTFGTLGVAPPQVFGAVQVPQL